MPNLRQQTLFDNWDVTKLPKSTALLEAVEDMATISDVEKRGAIFTRVEVVEFILDLVGYVSNACLHTKRILEPSFGNGDFLLPVIDRLLHSWRANTTSHSSSLEELGDAIRAVELHRPTFETTHRAVITKLRSMGIVSLEAYELANRWLIQGDFLLEPQVVFFDYVVGNPPYVRQELISEPLLSEYRSLFKTMYDRADLYVPFMERSLSLLNSGGILGFICSDRWMKNRYGRSLREFISKGFHLKTYVDMVGTEVFHSEVSAYPAITVIAKTKANVTRVVHRPKIDKNILAQVSIEITSEILPPNSSVNEVLGVVNGSEPWLLDTSSQIKLIRRIENQLPHIEDIGCKIGIGVATGADKVFIGDFDSLDVEPDRKLPLVTTRDIQSGEIVWRGKGVINPFTDIGKLVALEDYPRLAHYLENHKEIITKRHCAQKTPLSWYRTIDHIRSDLTYQPKLLIPDIKGKAHVVYDSGKFYPHHNIYYVISEIWNLRALQAVMQSSVSKLFIETYSTKMRGGYLRFQAQYIRRIRIPFWKDVSENLRNELIHAANIHDLDACNKSTFKLYGLSQEEISSLLVRQE
ncbi:MAG: Eco57I restriction-modification methylase domain-containing protein [Synergistaceae bacterium]|jgi:hypothetical protein|nr:Eco57I restriction-modification methylase domain-containing protein [Synergistaceae bacterium]